MTVYLWRAYVGGVLEAAGARSDHRGSPAELADMVGTELRAAGVAVDRVFVGAALWCPFALLPWSVDAGQ